MAEALTKAIEMYASAPQSTITGPAVAPGQTQREDIVRSVKRFEGRVAQWRADMLVVQQGLAHMYKTLSQLPDPAAFLDQMSKLDEFIDDVDKEVASERLALEQSQFSNRQYVATMMKSSPSNAQFMKKMLKRHYEAGVVQHNARVDFYHFLLAERAEHNPDYRGGPTFDNAEDLIADLHKHTR